ncbi:sigma-70 family RNA polymerase sigma factor [Ideonella sp. BN130291]|uniref:sigma-70 family RNA polymerase sigma factor n=1 Tax=Ideonella sp. BN130291 TaxID=3112940 RepID=UPI002E2617E4|nr:sigma-70 family RNA polymerase sigma factor [Ideonella sp. BN130291]
MSSPPTTDLAALMARIVLKDRAAFEQLYRLTSAHLLGVATRILGSPARGEEVLHEAYMNVWHGAGSYRPGTATPMTWMINIVRNKAIDTLRSNATERATTVPLPDEGAEALAGAAADGEQPQHLLDNSLQRLQIDTCMGHLSAQQRQALALAYYHGLMHSEIAERLGAPLGTAKAWVRRGLARLKDCLVAAGLEAA